jgi:hypothetical protein
MQQEIAIKKLQSRQFLDSVQHGLTTARNALSVALSCSRPKDRPELEGLKNTIDAIEVDCAKADKEVKRHLQIQMDSLHNMQPDELEILKQFDDKVFEFDGEIFEWLSALVPSRDYIGVKKDAWVQVKQLINVVIEFDDSVSRISGEDSFKNLRGGDTTNWIQWRFSGARITLEKNYNMSEWAKEKVVVRPESQRMRSALLKAILMRLPEIGYVPQLIKRIKLHCGNKTLHLPFTLTNSSAPASSI